MHNFLSALGLKSTYLENVDIAVLSLFVYLPACARERSSRIRVNQNYAPRTKIPEKKVLQGQNCDKHKQKIKYPVLYYIISGEIELVVFAHHQLCLKQQIMLNYRFYT